MLSGMKIEKYNCIVYGIVISCQLRSILNLNHLWDDQ